MAPPSSSSSLKLNANGVPDFDDLPLDKANPPYSAWGLYGPDDELGTLNRLTDERVAAAAKSEIKTGERVSLNAPLNCRGDQAFFGRKAFHQELLAKPPRTVNDDVWTFNSQCSSQWDGLRHFGYQHERVFYNGITMEDIHGHGGCGNSTVNGIQAWAEKGIVGRGVLIDFERWRLAQSGPEYKNFAHFDSTPITLDDLKACLAVQGTEVRFGDILFVRSGWTSAQARLPDADLARVKDLGSSPRFCGVEATEPVLRWIWDRFAAVAGDHPSFEAWGNFPPSQQDGKRNLLLHEVLLAGWGCPIGELFDLEALAARCAAEGRWSFFVASEVCHVLGGVASPPNVLAIF